MKSNKDIYRYQFIDLVTEIDSLPETLDSYPEPLTRDFIGLCIGILSLVLVILIVVVCKWSRCRCLKKNHHEHDEDLTSVINHNTSAFRPARQRQRDENQRSSVSCNHPGNGYPPTNRTRNGNSLLSAQSTYNESQSKDLKVVPRVTITTLPVQPSQQQVPRLSISPQVSESSITRSSCSIKQ